MTRLFSQMLNGVTCGDCIDVMSYMPSRSVDFVLTDPPYITRYRPYKNNAGQTVTNDDNGVWLKPAFGAMYRVLRPDSLCISFYGTLNVALFNDAWRSTGFRVVGHIVFVKKYPSSTRFMCHQHESAFLLAKGTPAFPYAPIPDVIEWQYTGNRLHPTQKPVQSLKPLIAAFTEPHGIVLDPFSGSGSTLVAARDLGRRFIGIDLDPDHHRTATHRLRQQLNQPRAKRRERIA